jgi:hypothetical protein
VLALSMRQCSHGVRDGAVYRMICLLCCMLMILRTGSSLLASHALPSPEPEDDDAALRSANAVPLSEGIYVPKWVRTPPMTHTICVCVCRPSRKIRCDEAVLTS